MHRDLRELAVLLVAGLALGLGHLALRTDLPWIPAPRAESTMCGGEEQLAGSPAPASLVSSEPLSSPAPEDAP
jgi:hypothetical protein